MTRCLLCVALLAGCGGGGSEGPPSTPSAGGEEGESLGLMNEVRISDEVILSGQPTPGQLDALPDRGVQTVVNLHAGPPGSDAPEREALETRGVCYVALHLESPEDLTAELVERLVDELMSRSGDGAEGLTLMHCGDGGSSAAMNALIVFLAGGAVDEALAAYDATGQTSWRGQLAERLDELCSQQRGGCAPSREELPVLEEHPRPEGYPDPL